MRPTCPAIDATDAAALPNTLLLTIPVYIHANLFLFGVAAGGIGFQGPIHWRSVLDTGVGVWKMPDKEPVLYMIW